MHGCQEADGEGVKEKLMELQQGVLVPRVCVGGWVGNRRASSQPGVEFSHSCTHSSAQIFPVHFLMQVSSKTSSANSDIFQWYLSRMDGLIPAPEHFQSFSTCPRFLELLPDLWISGTELVLDLPEHMVRIKCDCVAPSWHQWRLSLDGSLRRRLSCALGGCWVAPWISAHWTSVTYLLSVDSQESLDIISDGTKAALVGSHGCSVFRHYDKVPHIV